MSHLKTAFENLTVKKAFHWGVRLSTGPHLLPTLAPVPTLPAYLTTSNTSNSVIFISKVLIILLRDFRPCFISNGERARVHSVRHFCNGISDSGNGIHEY